MFNIEIFRKKMSEVLERFNTEISKVRTGRAHPDMLGSVRVEAYGSLMPLNQVANVTAADATMLLITPFDPSTIQAITAAISMDQSLGLNPSDDGRVVRVPIPALTEERRKEVVKNASERTETAKIGLRGVREDGRKEVKKLKDEKALSEDEAKRLEKALDDLIKEFQDKIEKAFADKSAEIMRL
ncbi:MAG: ribosome recycling factor [Candidatus Nomurabacteria bacterium]|jgi:ribosome recycling factor|nr:ribosome recycling factor [Candidatus Nomurabacteria bacterium]